MCVEGFEKPRLLGQCESPQIHSTIMISLHNMVMPLCVSNVVFFPFGEGAVSYPDPTDVA